MRYILAPLFFLIGVLLIKYSVRITDEYTGEISFAEKYLGTGVGAGTYTWWKIVGFVICAASVLWLFGKLPGQSGSGGGGLPENATSMLQRLL